MKAVAPDYFPHLKEKVQEIQREDVFSKISKALAVPEDGDGPDDKNKLNPDTTHSNVKSSSTGESNVT